MKNIDLNTIYCVDSLAGLKMMADESVHIIVTSPPYFGLRDYGVAGQIGLEATPEEYIAKMVSVFREARRVLRRDGTLWLNIGDSYAGYHGNKNAKYDEAPSNKNGYFENQRRSTVKSSTLQGGKATQASALRAHEVHSTPGLKPKDLIGIPWMLAFALRADGWYLRQDIIWSKPNPMPESVTDRCTKSHEYIFLLSKSKRYYYDQESIMKDACGWNGSSFDTGKTGEMKHTNGHRKSGNKERKPASDRGVPTEVSGVNGAVAGSVPWEGLKANKRSVWEVATKPYKEAHFATFPPELIVDMIKAGCPEGGVVLDVFMGAGTTAVVAKKLNRNFIGFEINPKYIEIAEKRLYNEIGMFL